MNRHVLLGAVAVCTFLGFVTMTSEAQAHIFGPAHRGVAVRGVYVAPAGVYVAPRHYRAPRVRCCYPPVVCCPTPCYPAYRCCTPRHHRYYAPYGRRYYSPMFYGYGYGCCGGTTVVPMSKVVTPQAPVPAKDTVLRPQAK